MRCVFFQRQAWPVTRPAAAVHSSKTKATDASLGKPVVAHANTSSATAAAFKNPCALTIQVAARGHLAYRSTAKTMPSSAELASSQRAVLTKSRCEVKWMCRLNHAMVPSPNDVHARGQVEHGQRRQADAALTASPTLPPRWRPSRRWRSSPASEVACRSHVRPSCSHAWPAASSRP
jgi:hypothetical protein